MRHTEARVGHTRHHPVVGVAALKSEPWWVGGVLTGVVGWWRCSEVFEVIFCGWECIDSVECYFVRADWCCVGS
jgi:hypothetical protein